MVLFLETLVVLRASLKSSIKLGMLEIYQHTVKEKGFSGYIIQVKTPKSQFYQVKKIKDLFLKEQI